MSIVNGEWAMGNEQSAISNEQSAMSNGQWAMSNGQSAMGNRQWAIFDNSIHHSPLTPSFSFILQQMFSFRGLYR